MIISFSFCWCNFEFNGILALVFCGFFYLFVVTQLVAMCGQTVYTNLNVAEFVCILHLLSISYWIMRFLSKYYFKYSIHMGWIEIISLRGYVGHEDCVYVLEILYKKLCKIALPSIFICFTFFAYMTLLLMMLIFQFNLSNNFSIETVQRFRLLVENKSLISIRTLKLNITNRNVT